MLKRIAVLALFALLPSPAGASARAILYGSPGPEQEQLQQWIDTSHAATPNVPVRLFEGNCNEGEPGGARPETNETEPEAETRRIQTCAALASPANIPPARNQAIFIPHMTWHPQYPAWWWHLNVLNEMGHVYDLLANDRGHYREKFSRIFDYNAAWWWPVTPAGMLNVEYEKWSMAFAFCGYGAGYANAHALLVSGAYSGFGFEPTASEYARTCRLIHSLGVG